MENNSYVENKVYLIFPNSDYDVAILTGSEELNAKNDNVDVEVRFKNGELYTASFFTIENIASLFEKNKGTGECLSGLYFSSSDMVIVKIITFENIVNIVNGLIKEKSLFDLFKLQSSD
jgi:hypothetical protein